MGPRTGTPMRLVSPAPVLVPPGAQRAPQASIYPPQPQNAQQNLYSQQNGSSVGGNLLIVYIRHTVIQLAINRIC